MLHLFFFMNKKWNIITFTAYRGKDGLLTVSSGTATPMADVYRRGFEELGYSTVDCNGESQTGEPMQNHLFMMNLELRISARWYNVKQPNNKKDLQ